MRSRGSSARVRRVAERRIALAYVVEGDGGADDVLAPNGRDFLIVTADCRYFVQPAGGEDSFEPVHVGTLTSGELAAINDELMTLPWGSYPALVGEAGIIDATGPFMERDGAWVACRSDCGEAGAARAASLEWSERLYASGVPSDFGMWVAAGAAGAGPYWSFILSDYIEDAGGNRERVAYVYDRRACDHKHLASNIFNARTKKASEWSDGTLPRGRWLIWSRRLFVRTPSPPPWTDCWPTQFGRSRRCTLPYSRPCEL